MYQTTSQNIRVFGLGLLSGRRSYRKGVLKYFFFELRSLGILAEMEKYLDKAVKYVYSLKNIEFAKYILIEKS